MANIPIISSPENCSGQRKRWPTGRPDDIAWIAAANSIDRWIRPVSPPNDPMSVSLLSV